MSGPIPRSYCVGEALLYAGAYPGSGDVAALCMAGVDLFVDLTEPDELEPYAHLLPDGAEHVRFPMPDFTAPRAAYAGLILDALDAALAEGRTLYLHCRGGRGRTGSIVGCWLVRCGWHGSEALAELDRLRRGLPDAELPSPETEEQLNLVLGWQPGT